MTITQEARTQLVNEHQRHDKDTGSPEIQVAVLTKRISGLTEHLKTHRHDFASRRGLVMLVGRRNRLLRYLQRTERERYQELIKSLGLRR
ncbi:MAG: 30S ribosomal protein S15 [Phycisphaerales bacterium]